MVLVGACYSTHLYWDEWLREEENYSFQEKDFLTWQT
jgi:hypothetical protein